MAQPKPSQVRIVHDATFAGGQRVDVYVHHTFAARGDMTDGLQMSRESAEELLRDLMRALAVTAPGQVGPRQ